MFPKQGKPRYKRVKVEPKGKPNPGAGVPRPPRKQEDPLPVISTGSIEEMRVELDKWGLTVADANVDVVRRNLWGRNETCPCKSGKKFKKCCQSKLEYTYICRMRPDLVVLSQKRMEARKAQQEKKAGEAVVVQGTVAPEENKIRVEFTPDVGLVSDSKNADIK